MEQNKFKYELRYHTQYPGPCALALRKVFYQHLTQGQLIELFKACNKNNQHPRVMARQEDFDFIRENIKTDPRAKKYYEDVIATANEELTKPVCQTCDRHFSTTRTTTLCMAYKLTNDEKYALRAWQELENTCSFSNWQPVEKLDFGYILKGVAIGYDWLYSYLTEQQREIIRMSILSKVFWTEQKVFEDPYHEGLDVHNVFGNTNHNVSINCGLLMAACALLGEENTSEISADIIEGVMWSLENYLPEFLEHGSGKEGVYYWYWPMESTDEIMSTLNATFKTSFGIQSTPGIEKMGYFPVYMVGANGYSFNWGNGHPSLKVNSHAGTSQASEGSWQHPDVFISADLFYLSTLVNDPTLAYARARTIEKFDLKATTYDLLWYRPFDEDCKRLANDCSFKRVEAVGMFSDWENPKGISLGFKAGFNNEVHGSLNTGSFVIDALGQRWACLLGSEVYSVPGYWDYSENGSRWTYYRMRAEGQNAIVINPKNGPDQYPFSVCEIERYESNDDKCFAIVDAKQAFKTDATVHSIKRGMSLESNRTEILLQDELLADNADYWFFMHTTASMEIASNGKYACLSSGNKYMHVFLHSNSDTAVFSIMPAKPLPQCPQTTFNSDNSHCQKLAVHVDNANNLTVQLRFVPSESKDMPQDKKDITPLSKWNI